MKLSDVCTAIVDCAHKTAPIDPAGEYYAVGTPAMRGHRINLEEARRINLTTFRSWTERLTPRHGDLLLAREAPVGPVVRIPPTENVAPGQRTVLLRPDPAQADSRYLYYFLIAPQQQMELQVKAAGSTVPHLNVADVRSFPASEIPHLTEQRAIAEVLGALDDKIAANTSAVGKLLDLDDTEFTARLRYSTRSERLDALAAVVKGVSYRRADLAESSTALVTLKSVGRDRRFARRGFKPYVGDYRATQAVTDGEIVVAQTDLTQAADVIGTAVRVPRVENYERLVASLDLAIVRSTSDVPDKYLLGVLRRRQFRMHCQERMSGTTVLHLARGAIESYQVPLLPDDDMKRIAQASNDRYHLADALAQESTQLAATRDELLPLLMSGKVRVRDAEKIVEEAV